MKIVWVDSVLKEHTIDLSGAVEVKINGISLSVAGNGLGVRTNDSKIKITPVASNSVTVSADVT